MKQKIALLGFGTVGQGLCEILLDKKDYLKEKYNYDFDIVAVADFAYGNVYNPNGLDVPKMIEEAKVKQQQPIIASNNNAPVTTNQHTTINQPSTPFNTDRGINALLAVFQS